VKLETIVLVVGAFLTGLPSAPYAFAQDDDPIQVSPEKTAAAAALAQQTTPQKFHLELDAADLNSLSIAINELPKRVADPLVMKLNEQIKAQVQAKQGGKP